MEEGVEIAFGLGAGEFPPKPSILADFKNFWIGSSYRFMPEAIGGQRFRQLKQAHASVASMFERKQVQYLWSVFFFQNR